MKKLALLFIAIIVILGGYYSYIKNKEDFRIEEIGFITHNFADSPLAAGEGKLVLKDKCLYLERDNTLYLPLWPDRFQLAIVDGDLALLKEKTLFAKVGQSVTFGGGYFEKRRYVEGIGLDYTKAKHCDFSHVIFVGSMSLAKE